jgi:aryl-alcohol dehydrogenase-like predicted oxidoreductase
MPYCNKKGIDTFAYGVLCRGLLTDDFLEKGALEFDTMQSSLAHVKENFPLYRKAVDQISGYLEKENINQSLASTLIAWTLSHPSISHSLVVAHNIEQVDVIAGALKVNLSSEQADKITSIVQDTIGENLEKDFITPPHS